MSLLYPWEKSVFLAAFSLDLFPWEASMITKSEVNPMKIRIRSPPLLGPGRAKRTPYLAFDKQQVLAVLFEHDEHDTERHLPAHRDKENGLYQKESAEIPLFVLRYNVL
jgi:hypothetical protein